MGDRMHTEKRANEEQLCKESNRATIIFDPILTDHYNSYYIGIKATVKLLPKLNQLNPFRYMKRKHEKKTIFHITIIAIDAI